MPSSYTNNLGIEKPNTGEQTGTWGTTVNLNFDHYDQAISGAVTVILPAAGSSGSPNDLPITNGTTTNGRYAYITFDDAGDLGADAYVQLTPDTRQRIMFIENALTGGRNLYLFQGTYDSGRDLVLGNGRVALVFFNGGGASLSYCNNLLSNMYGSGTIYLTNVNASGSVTLSGAVTMSGAVTLSNTVDVTGTLKVDTITDSSAAGLTIEGVTINNNNITTSGVVDVTGTLKADTITDSSAGGLTIEGVTINNNNITTSGTVDVTGTLKADTISDSSGSGVAIENVTILNGAVSTSGTVTTSTYASMDHLVLPEKAATPSFSAGQGKVWTRNTTPSTLWYTADNGGVFPLAYTGSFTPTLQDGSYSDSEGQTYSSQVGNYILVGDMCFISGKIILTSKGTLTDTLNIGNLPFGADGDNGVLNVMGTGLNLSTVGSLSALVSGSTPVCIVYNTDWNATGANPIQASDITDSAAFYFSGFYQISTGTV